MRFQEITVLALNANYGGNDWFDQHSTLKYQNIVMTRSHLFDVTMEQYGQSYEFKAEDINPSQVTEDTPTILQESDESDKSQERLLIRTTRTHVELQGVMFEEDSISKIIGHDTMQWLTKIYTTSRGFELGTFDSSLLAMAMKAQSSKWNAVALAYIADVVNMAHTFVVNLLRLVCPDPQVREGLMSILMNHLMAKYQAAFDSGRFLLRVERLGTPVTLNHYFNDNLEKRFVTCRATPIPHQD